jgi:hypothetical protein
MDGRWSISPQNGQARPAQIGSDALGAFFRQEPTSHAIIFPPRASATKQNSSNNFHSTDQFCVAAVYP